MINYLKLQSNFVYRNFHSINAIFLTDILPHFVQHFLLLHFIVKYLHGYFEPLVVNGSSLVSDKEDKGLFNILSLLFTELQYLLAFVSNHACFVVDLQGNLVFWTFGF